MIYNKKNKIKFKKKKKIIINIYYKNIICLIVLYINIIYLKDK